MGKQWIARVPIQITRGLGGKCWHGARQARAMTYATDNSAWHFSPPTHCLVLVMQPLELFKLLGSRIGP